MIFNFLPDYPFKLQKIYSMKGEYSCSAAKFHESCDDQGPTLVIIRTENGFEFGGYTEQSWKSTNGFKPDKRAFVFSFTRRKKEMCKNNQCIYASSKYGPTFGDRNIYIADDCGSNNDSYTQIHSSYSNITLQKSFNRAPEHFKVKKFEVFKFTPY